MSLDYESSSTAPLGERSELAHRHAFMVMAHTDAPVLQTLLRLLDDERNDIYLHVDVRSRDIDLKAVQKCVTRASLELVTPTKVNWGGFSQVRCELALLERASRDRHSYYHLLSGADLPLLDQDALHAFFRERQGTEFVHFVPGPLPPHVADRVVVRGLFPERGRLSARGRFVPWLQERAERLHARSQRRYRRSLAVPVADLRWGSQWFSITHDLARHVVGESPWVERTFHRATCADELFLQTLVHRSRFSGRLLVGPDDEGEGNGCARLIDWARGDGNSPHTWRLNDLDELMRAREAGYVFARKFSSAVDADVVRAVASVVSGPSAAGRVG